MWQTKSSWRDFPATDGVVLSRSRCFSSSLNAFISVQGISMSPLLIFVCALQENEWTRNQIVYFSHFIWLFDEKKFRKRNYQCNIIFFFPCSIYWRYFVIGFQKIVAIYVRRSEGLTGVLSSFILLMIFSVFFFNFKKKLYKFWYFIILEEWYSGDDGSKWNGSVRLNFVGLTWVERNESCAWLLSYECHYWVSKSLAAAFSFRRLLFPRLWLHPWEFFDSICL